VSEQLYEKYISISVHLPYNQGGLISLYHELGQVERVEHMRGGVRIQGKLPGRLMARFKPFAVNGRGSPVELEDSLDNI
jgi:GTP-binding protein HflX